jgi:hypothetical protein
VAAAAGDIHSLGLKSDGSIVGWGYNFDGECNVPAPNADFIAVSGGWKHSLGLKADGTIVAWGFNGFGECDVPEPNSGFVAISAGAAHNLALKSDGTMVAWGDNSSGECDVPSPNSGFVGIAAGFYYSIGLRSYSNISGDGRKPMELAIRPNPGGGRQDLLFALARSRPVDLRVVDLSGRTVVRLLDGVLDAGRHTVSWSGQDSGGRPVASGPYFLELRSDLGVARSTVVRLK